MEKKVPAVPTVFLVRHGPTAFNSTDREKDKLKGTRFDLPLNEKGKQKAATDAANLKPYEIECIYFSPMVRTRETAAEIAKAAEAPLECVEGLKPWDVGYLSGQTRDAARSRIEYYIRYPFRAVPEGEPYRDFWNAATDAVSRILKEARKADGALVVVTHSVVLLAVDALLEGSAPRPHMEGEMPPPGAIMLLERKGGRWQMREWKENS